MNKIINFIGAVASGFSLISAIVVYLKDKNSRKNIAIALGFIACALITAKAVADNELLPEKEEELKEEV